MTGVESVASSATLIAGTFSLAAAALTNNSSYKCFITHIDDPKAINEDHPMRSETARQKEIIEAYLDEVAVPGVSDLHWYSFAHWTDSVEDCFLNPSGRS